MKIALVCPASLPATQFGGILFLFVDIARESSNCGHDVTIYTTDLDFANNPKTFNKNLPRVEIVDNFKIKRTHVWLTSNLFFINPGMYFQMMKDCPDIIHTIGVRSFQSYIAAIVAKKKKIPLIVSDQGGLTTHPELKKGSMLKRLLYKLQTPMIKYIVNQASKIIVANEYEKQIFLSKEIGLKEKIGTPNNESKITIIRNGINLEILNQKATDLDKKFGINKKFFLFVGRFAKVKGLDVLLQAMNSIKNQSELKNMQLVIMGVDFGFESEMMHMIKNFELDKKIIVIKNPLRDDVITAYRESEFLVLPSRWELSPLTPLEGFAFKKPVISTVAHGIPSTITNEENGILVESENFAELGQAILEFCKDKNKCTKFGLAGHDLVKKECNSIKMVKHTLEIYKKIINR
jgi:glycosyltransferase involved in cell wall biosynthesis